MKNLFLSTFLFFFATAYSDSIDANSWSVTKNSPPLSYSAEFGIHKGDTSIGKVIRTGLFTPRYHYDLFDAANALQVRGITRAFSLGLLFAWGTEIDLYDQDGCIGMIKGEIWSTSRAKFAFYNANSEVTAHAYLNDESCNFLIVSAQNSGQVIAELKGKAYGDASMWEIKPINYPLNLDERALHIFAGFVADFQKSFIRPPKKETYYFYQDRRI